jgi:hypothetical protein
VLVEQTMARPQLEIWLQSKISLSAGDFNRGQLAGKIRLVPLHETKWVQNKYFN